MRQGTTHCAAAGGFEVALAVTSKVTLKLIPPPKASKAMMALFEIMDGASQAVAGIIAAHVVPCTLEFLDHASINYIERLRENRPPRDAGAMLLIEVDGHPAQVEDEAVIVEKVLRDNSATEIVVARDAVERAGFGKPAAWPFRAGPLPSHADAGRRHGAALQDPGHDQGPRRDRRPPQRHHRHLRPCRRRQSASVHPLRPPRQGRVLARGTGCGRPLQRRVGAWRHAVRRAWHRHRQNQMAGAGNLHGTIMFSRRLRKAFDPKGLFNPSKIVGFGD